MKGGGKDARGAVQHRYMKARGQQQHRYGQLVIEKERNREREKEREITHHFASLPHGSDLLQGRFVPQALALSQGCPHHLPIAPHSPNEGVIGGEVGLGRVAHHVHCSKKRSNRKKQ